MTRVVVAGSRGITDYHTVSGAIRKHYPHDSSPKYWDDAEIVTGAADGVDTSAERFANEHNIELTLFDPYNPAQTATEYSYSEQFGRAFLERNGEMAEYGDMLVAVWDGHSNGTRDMIEKMLDEGKPTYVEIYS